MEVSIISELQPPQLPLPLQKMLKFISGKMIYARLNDLECIILYIYLFIYFIRIRIRKGIIYLLELGKECVKYCFKKAKWKGGNRL